MADDVVVDGDPTPSPDPTPVPTPEPANWRDAVTDPEQRKVAERFATPGDAIKSVMDLRKRESSAIRLPGEDASDEDRASFRKAFGVPENAEGYEFAVPEGREVTDGDKAFQAEAALKFLDADLSSAQAAKMTEWWNDMQTASEEAQVAANQKFVEDSVNALKEQWGDDYERNKTLANRALTEMAGENIEALTAKKMDNGQFLLDDPDVVRLFEKVGSEMSESRIGPRVDESDRATLQEQAQDLQTRKWEARDKGDHALEKRLDAQELALYERLHGTEPLVGEAGRVN